MKNDFKVVGLPLPQFSSMFTMSDDELRKVNAVRLTADKFPGYPCRVSLQDAQVGECIIAVPFIHHDVHSPYLSSGPIFVREEAGEANVAINQIPEVLINRLLSVRAYDSQLVAGCHRIK